jgi:hypothetical protein
LVLFNGNTGDQYVRAAVNTQASVIEVLDPNGRVVASGASSLYSTATISLSTNTNVTGCSGGVG